MRFVSLTLLLYMAVTSVLLGQSTLVGSSLALTGDYPLSGGAKLRLEFNPSLKSSSIITEQWNLRLPHYLIVYEIKCGIDLVALSIGRQRHPGEVYYRHILVIQPDGEGLGVFECAHVDNLVEWKERKDCAVSALRSVEGDVLNFEVCYGRYANPPTPIDSQEVRWSISQDALLKEPAR